jgi:hypothetical protein
MRPSLFLPLLLFVAGCATFGIKDESLEVQITPLPLHRGQPATAKVNAPMSAEKVIGTVEVMGSPQLEFEKDESKRLWYFYGTIPFSPWVNPGTYTVRVAYYQGSDKPRYTEMKVDLK